MRTIAALKFAPHRLATYSWGIALGALAIALLAFAAGPTTRDASAQVGPCPFTIDFTGLPAGTILGEQYQAQGVHISGLGREDPDNPQEIFPDALIVFDTNDTVQDHDPDLHINIDNIAIFAKNLTDANGDDLVDDPDENNFGGTATFAFDQDVSIGSVKWIDKDHVANNFVIAYNAAGEVIVSVPVPLGANSSVQTIAINADGVRRLVFAYEESGGFTGIEVDCEQATSTPTAQAETPTPTAAPTATPSPAPATPTPPVATSTQAPPAPSPSPSPGVAAATATPNAGTSTGTGPSAGALPAGGGNPSARDLWSQWAPLLLLLALISGATFVSMRGQRR